MLDITVANMEGDYIDEMNDVVLTKNLGGELMIENAVFVAHTFT